MIEITSEFLISQGLYLNFPQRFWVKVDVRQPWECWPWLAAQDGNGYGVINKGPKGYGLIKAYRAAWILTNGAVPEGLEICHKCPVKPNPLCCNPAHLKPQTHAQNMRDMIEQGDHYFSNCEPYRGERCGTARLTWSQIDEIRSAFTGQRGQLTALGKRFGVHRSTIAFIVKNERWCPQWHP